MKRTNGLNWDYQAMLKK